MYVCTYVLRMAEAVYVRTSWARKSSGCLVVITEYSIPTHSLSFCPSVLAFCGCRYALIFHCWHLPFVITALNPNPRHNNAYYFLFYFFLFFFYFIPHCNAPFVFAIWFSALWFYLLYEFHTLFALCQRSDCQEKTRKTQKNWKKNKKIKYAAKSMQSSCLNSLNAAHQLVFL